MSRIAIVNINSFGREFPEYITELEEKVGEVRKFDLPNDISGKELAEKLNGYTYVILGTHPEFQAEFFAENKTVRLIARHGLGVNNVDLEAAEKAGVYVTKEPGIVERDAVAEQAVALLLSLAKNIPRADQKVKAGQWRVDRQELVGYQLYEMTTGIIGFGNIGRRVGEIMKDGFHNRLLIYDPFISAEDAAAAGAEKVELDTLLEQSDFISLHCALVDSTRGMISTEQFRKMKKSAILIDTARGALIDEAALIQALKDHEIWGYGADVAVHEPIEPDNELLQLEHVIITPHVAVYNRTCTSNMNRKVMNDIYLMEEGKKPENIINNL
jgi:phosphoglycerate dehydrogenase-like enzyme